MFFTILITIQYLKTKQINPKTIIIKLDFGEHAKVYFKDIITSYTEKIRSRSIGYDVIEAIEGERSFNCLWIKNMGFISSYEFFKAIKF